MKKLILIVILSLLCLLFPKLALAQEANKFGIHILEPVDVEKAAKLVNSNGGDWGWVTIVIRDDDLNYDKWQDFMDQCREKHLILIVRIATHLEGSNWVKPKIDDAQKWAEFLNKLNWPVSDQYVIIFNEPNQAKEWGGEVNPKEYAKILSTYADKFHSLNSKFLILNSGFDLAAPNSKTTMDAFRFMQEMNWEIPGIFEKLDGWASHSYPNHGYLGKPWETGKTSIRGYDWELTVLKNVFAVKKVLPVFITETGWPKMGNGKIDVRSGKRYYNEKTVADYFKYAFENVWLKDNRIKSVTPFVMNYQDKLFSDFSWFDKNGNEYLQCSVVKNIPKTSYWPKQETKFEIININIPHFLPIDTEYRGKLFIKNVGQSILGESGTQRFIPTYSEGIKVSDLIIPFSNNIIPGEQAILDFTINSSSKSGEFVFSWENFPEYKVRVYPASVITKAQFTLWQNVLNRLQNILFDVRNIF